ncbi:MAG: AI-2E family transporter [Pseudoflavonifractor sp.]|nr:AI-2E family transporter [Pseudoflavonifractor sp.]
MTNRRPYTLDRVVRLVITIAVIAIALYFINLLKDVLLPFCVSCLIAYLLEPFVQFNRRLLNLRGRTTAIFCTLFEATFFVGVLCYFFIPSIIQEMAQVGTLIKQYSQTELNIPFMPNGIHRFIRTHLDLEYLSTLLTRQEWIALIKTSIAGTWGLVSTSIGWIISVFSWLVVFLYVIFIMLDYDRLSNGFRRMVPPRYREITFRLGRDLQQSMNHYFRGQALVALCVGILFSIGFLIIDLPLAIVLGLFIGLLNMVPYLQLISIPITAMLCLVMSVDQGINFWVIFSESMAVYCVVQAIQDLILTPKIMGKAMGLNPALILLSLSIWGTLLGLLGMIVALPLTTLLLAYYNRYIIQGGDGTARNDTKADGKSQPAAE